jgi:hypothetical protein
VIDEADQVTVAIIHKTYILQTPSGVLGGGGGVLNPQFFSFDKAELNSQFHEKDIRNNLVRIWVSLICKLSGAPD